MAADTTGERRREARHTMSMPVWWQDPSERSSRRGLILDVSGHGASFLAPAEATPAIGDRVDLSLIDPELGTNTDVAGNLLTSATVYRLDDVAPTMKRVALHFMDELWTRDPNPFWQQLTRMVYDRPEPAHGEQSTRS